MSSGLSFREQFKMGFFTLPSQVKRTTLSGRVTKPPRRFHQEHFVKGSGACTRRGYDGTDMDYTPPVE